MSPRTFICLSTSTCADKNTYLNMYVNMYNVHEHVNYVNMEHGRVPVHVHVHKDENRYGHDMDMNMDMIMNMYKDIDRDTVMEEREH